MCSMILMTLDFLVPCSCCLCRRNEKLEGILKFSDKFWRLHNSLIVDCNLPSLLDCQTRRDGLQKLKESGLIESKARVEIFPTAIRKTFLVCFETLQRIAPH